MRRRLSRRFTGRRLRLQPEVPEFEDRRHEFQLARKPPIASGRARAAMRRSCLATLLGCQLSGGEFARPTVAGRPLAAVEPLGLPTFAG